MRGRKYRNTRPDLIILDDYQSEDDVRTEEARVKKWKKYSDDVKFAKQRPVKRNGKIIKKAQFFWLGVHSSIKNVSILDC